MRIVLGADHAGYELKEKIKEYLARQGHQVEDMGTIGCDSVDYPEYAARVATAVSRGRFERGILVCGSGIGMAMTANKLPGVRAAVCNDLSSARLSREHNDANILAIGSRLVEEQLAAEIVDNWLRTKFTGGRHQRRLDMISDLEKRN